MAYFNRTMIFAIMVSLYTMVMAVQQLVVQYRLAHQPKVVNEIVRKPITQKEFDCLIKNVYYEAQNQGEAGMIAVAQVTLNRYESGHFAKTICGVVYQKNQFSWVKDRVKRNKPINKKVYAEVKKVVAQVLIDGRRYPELKDAMHYHADWISKPKWAYSKKQLGKVGQHIFYS